MKIQHLAVIFIIIIMPIVMVLSVYIDNLTSVTNKQAKYDTVLSNATSDAVKAYQQSTIDDEFASINASRTRSINATINYFFNSLATGLASTGYKKNELNAYIPAILITLYDGYFVYGPYENYAEVKDGKLNYRTDSGKQEYGLKPYTYYTCEYKQDNDYDIIVNYTLDNYISVFGNYQDGGTTKYITGSGYYIKTDGIEFDDDNKTVKIKRSGQPEVVIEPEELSEYISAFVKKKDTSAGMEQNYWPDMTTEGKIVAKKYRYINYGDEKYYWDDAETAVLEQYMSYQGVNIFKVDNNVRTYISQDRLKEIKKDLGMLETEDLTKDKFKDISNYKYYKESFEFSNKFNKVLSKINLSEDVIKTESYNKTYKIDTENKDGDYLKKKDKKTDSHVKSDYATKKIFDTSEAENDPELDSSSFNQHRMDVIISSIESTLANQISSFNNYQSVAYDYRMPTISETDWDRIANNVNILTFMQGLSVGNFKFYNNYSLVSNTKNKEYVSKEAIYVQPKANSSSDDYNTVGKLNYHLPICKEFHKTNNDEIVSGYRLIDYEIQSYPRGDESINFYLQPGTGDYECIISRNQDMYTYDELMTGQTTDTANPVNNQVRTAYISALARAKITEYKAMSHLNYNIAEQVSH